MGGILQEGECIVVRKFFSFFRFDFSIPGRRAGGIDIMRMYILDNR